LTSSGIRGAVDPLRGLKENIIAGNLIPAGTGINPNYIDMSDIVHKQAEPEKIRRSL
jgi:DNA-directed RNA polymerase subunit beta'